MKTPKALALLSGGLDSTLAVKLIQNQGIDVEALNFVTPFCLCKKGGCGAAETAKSLNIPLKVISAGKDYLKLIRKPKFGYGKNMNPCIDCRIFMLKKARQYAKDTGKAFIFTGEVLDQRPMSQHKKALDLIEEKAGLKGKILRPVSAKLLPPTEAETKGIVSREKLLDIQGRSRKKQIELAKQFQITNYPCPAGGCLLTYKEYADKLRDLFNNKKRVSLKDVQMLKIGRHYRFGKNKIIVGRNETENKTLKQMKMPSDYWFEAQNCGSPITLLQGPKTKQAIDKAALLTVYHCDQKTGNVSIKYGKENTNKSLVTPYPFENEIERLRIK